MMTRGNSSTNKAPPETAKTTAPGSEGHQPGEGIRSMKTSSVFRAVNFELYAKPVSFPKNPPPTTSRRAQGRTSYAF